MFLEPIIILEVGPHTTAAVITTTNTSTVAIPTPTTTTHDRHRRHHHPPPPPLTTHGHHQVNAPAEFQGTIVANLNRRMGLIQSADMSENGMDCIIKG